MRKEEFKSKDVGIVVDENNRFLPRVWDGEKYFYPVFSELGVTYQNADLPFTEENIHDVNWAYKWFFNFQDVPNLEKPFVQYEHILEMPINITDIYDFMLYEGDFIKDVRTGTIYKIDYCQEKAGYVARTNFSDDTLEGYDLWATEFEKLGNIHENPELLEKLGPSDVEFLADVEQLKARIKNLEELLSKQREKHIDECLMCDKLDFNKEIQQLKEDNEQMKKDLITAENAYIRLKEEYQALLSKEED